VAGGSRLGCPADPTALAAQRWQAAATAWCEPKTSRPACDHLRCSSGQRPGHSSGAPTSRTTLRPCHFALSKRLEKSIFKSLLRGVRPRWKPSIAAAASLTQERRRRGMDKGISLTVERFCCSDGWDSVSWSVDAVAGLASARRRDRHRPRGPCVGLPHEAWAAFKQSPRVQQVERWRIRGEMVSTRRGIPSATRAKLQPVHMPRAPDPATTARRVDHGPQPLLWPSTLFDETRRGVELWGEAHEQIPPQTAACRAKRPDRAGTALDRNDS